MKKRKVIKFRFGIRNAKQLSKKEGVYFRMIMRSANSYPEYETDDIFIKVRSENIHERNRALEILIVQHASLVCSIAGKYQNYGLSFADLVSEGNIGLMKAADKYDINKGVEFSTYASYWIRESITRALDNKSKIIRIPCQTAQKIRKLRTAEQELTNSLNRTPDSRELAKHTGLSEKQVQKLKHSMVKTYFFNAGPKYRDSDRNIDPEENYPDLNDRSPSDQMVQEDSHSFFNQLINRLDERESKIIKMYYGLGQQPSQTHLSISEHVGISRERVRQIQKESIQKLRKILTPHIDEIMPLMVN